MCGIVGLHLRTPELHPQLGQLLTGMLCQVGERGPDSAGVAVYGDPSWTPAGTATVSLLVDGPPDRLIGAVQTRLPDAQVRQVGQTVLVSAGLEPAELAATVRSVGEPCAVIGLGRSMAVLKGTKRPKQFAEQIGLAAASGWQGVAHTRMATESAVTPAHSHPFAVGPDQCLVHNGSFSNHASIRRELIAAGAQFDSDNDTEVGARFVAEQLRAGYDVEKSLHLLCDRFDGFYTLLVANDDSFAVVRDAIACKPAIIAETGSWVAMASEYRALAALPDIDTARIYEPEPERVYAWQR